MKKITLTGHVAHTQVNGEAKCGGVVARTKKPHQAVNFRSTLVKMMSRRVTKKNRAVFLKCVALYAKRQDTKQMSVIKIQIFARFTMLKMSKDASRRTFLTKKS